VTGVSRELRFTPLALTLLNSDMQNSAVITVSSANPVQLPELALRLP